MIWNHVDSLWAIIRRKGIWKRYINLLKVKKVYTASNKRYNKTKIYNTHLNRQQKSTNTSSLNVIKRKTIIIIGWD